MSKTMDFEGKTEKEAVANACTALKLAQEDLDYTVTDEGSGGVFGIGARPVQIQVRMPEAAEPEEAPAEEAALEASTEQEVVAAPEEETPSESAAAASEGGEEPKSGMVGPAPEKAAMALEVAQGLATRMGLEDAKITVRDEHAQIAIVIEDVDGSTEVGEVLGRSRPPAIPSFQFLLNKIVNRFPEDRKHIIVEVPSVPRRERKAAAPKAKPEARPAPELDPDLDPALVELARSLADRSQSLNKVLTVHPMLPADRRALHQTITTIDGVSTISEGEGLYRRLHIVPDSLGGGAKKRRRRRRRRRRPEGEGEMGANSQDNDGSDGPDDVPDDAARNDSEPAELQDNAS